MTTPEIISRKDAAGKALPRYFTGKPCKRGHIDERRVTTRQCIACMAHWVDENADSVRKSKRIHYEKHREKIIQRAATAAAADPEGRRKYLREYHEANKGKQVARMKRWRGENTDRCAALKAKRRAAKAQAIPAWFGEFDELVMLEATDLAQRREVATGIAWHVDHMVPLRALEASGLHCGLNIQVIPAKLNMVKQNKLQLTHPGEWISRL